MDGTTAGGLGTILPTPQSPTPTGGLMMNIDHSMSTPEPQPASMPTPSVPIPPLAPQFSQLTPVYAPGPTNTRADIPQPAVKGIEFVQAPTATSPAPVASTIPPVPEPIAMPSAPASPPTSQLIQPILPPVSPPPIVPVATTTNTVPTDQNVGTMSGAINYSAIENQLEDLDLDQVVGAVPPTPDFNIPAQVYVPTTVTVPAVAPTPPPAPTPVTPVIAPAAVLDQPLAKPPDAGKSYFENAYQAIAQPATPTAKAGRKSLSPVLIRRILIIAGIIIVLGVGGYFGVSALLGGHKSSTATTPAVTQPVFTQPTTSTDTTSTATNTTTSTTPSSTTTVPATTTTTTPDTTTTAPATTTTAPPAASPTPPATTTSTPVVSNTGLEW